MMYELCRHILASGRRCTQPSVSGTSYCRHHGVVKRTVAGSILPPKLQRLHRALPLLYPEDRASIQANCFLVMRALDDQRISTQTANAMNRLLRTCQANLKQGPLHESDSEIKQNVGAPFKRSLSREQNGEQAIEENQRGGLKGTGFSPSVKPPETPGALAPEEPADPAIVHRVILTPAGEELAPSLEVWEQNEQPNHGEECPCRRCAQQYRGAPPEQHHPDCRCGQCPAIPAGAPFNPASGLSGVDKSGWQGSSPADTSDEDPGAFAHDPYTFDEDVHVVPPDPYAPRQTEEERQQESKRRLAIMEKHKDRIAKVEKQYMYSPHLAERITDEIQQIMELEMGPEAFSYQPVQLAAS